MTEIIEELPRLSATERRELSRRLNALEAEQEDLRVCEESARHGFALLDAMEEEDEARGQRQ